MKSSRISKNLLHDVLEDGIQKIRTIASQVEDRLRDESETVAHQARNGFQASKGALVHAEETLADHIQKHPAPYIIAAFSILALLLAKLLLDQRAAAAEDEQEPEEA